MAVTTTRNPNSREVTDLLPAPNSRQSTASVNRNLDKFLQSLSEVLIDSTALEVNTMVVEYITGEKFIPWEAYRDIYLISQDYLARKGIHESLRDRYLHLRTTLELEYGSLIHDPKSEFYDPSALDSASEDNQIPTASTAQLHTTQTRLPDPHKPTSEEILKAQKLLHNIRFLRSLRKVSELKAALDSRNQALLHKQDELGYPNPDILHQAVTTDMIYAQTVIQLDGDIINRYSQEILDHPRRDVLLQIHREGVTAGEKQWRGLLEFIIGLMQASFQRGSSQDSPARDASRHNGKR